MECDLIVGNCSDDDVILNIVERKTRFSFAYKLPDKKVSSVMKAFDDFKNLFGENFDKVFHTITTAGGSDFSVAYISNVVLWANSLPRKIFNYSTSVECFISKFNSALI